MYYTTKIVHIKILLRLFKYLLVNNIENNRT